jgi:hypothetical protein
VTFPCKQFAAFSLNSPLEHPIMRSIGFLRRFSPALLALVFFLASATASSAQEYNYPESASVNGGGTLTFTSQVQMGYCGNEYQEI